MPNGTKKDLKALDFSGGKSGRMLKSGPSWNFPSVVVTPENPNPTSDAPKNVVVSTNLLQNIVSQIACSKRSCKGNKGSQSIVLQYSGVTCSSVSYVCLLCGTNSDVGDGSGFVPSDTKSSFYKKAIRTIKKDAIVTAHGGKTRVGWFQPNIQIALATLLNGVGGSEVETLAAMMNFPNAKVIEKQNHQIEKDILIPSLIKLQQQVLMEAMIEEAVVEMKKIGVSGEVVEAWISSRSWEERSKIFKIGIHTCA